MRGPLPIVASKAARAVFLSYASKDAEAASRIADALRLAGVDVWFDKSELRGGVAWDRQIRQRIHDCQLFIAVISANTESRGEGYFRREWRLAVERAGDMAEDVPFLLPVVIDETSDAAARVPDRFRDVQWSRAPDGNATSAFAVHVRHLLSPEPSPNILQRSARLESDAAPAVRTPPHGRRSRRTLLVLAFAAMAGVAYLAFDRFMLSRRLTPEPTVIADKSLAVLPFVDLSEKHDQQYFADGMAEEILDLLVKIPGLRVIGRTSSFQFRGKSVDVRLIGSQLQVAYLLEGSVRRANDQVRVTAQLLSTADGSHRWSNTYNSKIDDVLQVQDAIAAGISRALELAISGAAVQDHVSMSAEAYDLFVRGLHSLDTSSQEACEQAIGLFSQVLRLHPNSERALVSLARAHECIGYGDWSVPAAGFEQAREFARRALQVNPRSADAHLVLARVYILHDFEWTAAQREIETAASVADPSARALTIAAQLSLALGQFDHAIELLNQAISRDPLDPLIYDTLGDTYFRAGQFNKSEAMYRRCLQIEPQYIIGHYYLSNAIMMQGRLQEALTESDRGSPGDGGYEAGRALILHAMGRSREADAALKILIETAANDWPYEVARVYAYRDERDAAFNWLDQAYRQHNTDLYYIKGDPLLRSLYSDPRYRTFLRKLNLPE